MFFYNQGGGSWSSTFVGLYWLRKNSAYRAGIARLYWEKTTWFLWHRELLSAWRVVYWK